MTMRPVTRLAPFLIAIAAWAQQPYLNLDFETATRGILWYWAIATPGYDYSVDTMEFQSGAQSLRIRSTAAASNPSSTLCRAKFPDLHD